jgi:hypothetical protein
MQFYGGIMEFESQMLLNKFFAELRKI